MGFDEYIIDIFSLTDYIIEKLMSLMTLLEIIMDQLRNNLQNQPKYTLSSSLLFTVKFNLYVLANGN